MSGNPRITERTIERVLENTPQLALVWAAVFELLCHDVLQLFSLIRKQPLAIEFAREHPSRDPNVAAAAYPILGGHRSPPP